MSEPVVEKKKSHKKKKHSSKTEKAQKAFTIPYIDPGEIELKGLLGKGCFGKVYAGECRSMEVAVKIPKKQNLSKRALRNFIKEVEIMSKIYHPNVCLFMGACTEPGQIRIVSEKLGLDLDDKIHDMEDDIPLTQRIQWAKETCQGIAWLHGSDPPIVHRDLKPANMLLDEHNKIKVCDFGLSHFMEDGLYDKEPKGEDRTPLYMAPEVMRKEEITEKVDVYSIGVITWELLTREDPFVEHDDYQTFVDAVCNDDERPIIPSWCPRSLRDIIEVCWQPDPNARPSMAEVINLLDQSIQDCASLDFGRQVEKLIKDKNGRAFWKKNFPSKLSVGWREFIRKLFAAMQAALPSNLEVKKLTKQSTAGELMKAGKDQLKSFSRIDDECAKLAKAELNRRSKGGPSMYQLLAEEGGMTDDLRNIYSLKALLNAESSEIVTIEEFGKLLQRLGPLEIPEIAGNGFMDRIADLLCNSWFHGELPTKTAENMLRIAAPGTFLVRFSNSSHNSYCITSVNSKKKVQHVVITHKGNGIVELAGKRFESVCDLITQKGTKLHLIDACPGSKFAWLHEEDVAAVIGYGVDY